MTHPKPTLSKPHAISGTPPVPRLLTLLLSTALLLTFPACDSGDSDDGNGNGGGGSTIGSVSVSITGDIAGSFSGNAYFVVDDSDFSIGLIGGTLNEVFASQIVAFGREGGRPATGTYTFGNDASDFSGGYADYEGTDGDLLSATVVSADSGTLTITSSSSDRVAGSFSFTGTVANINDPTNTGTATVAGTFSAEFLDPEDVPDIGGF